MEKSTTSQNLKHFVQLRELNKREQFLAERMNKTLNKWTRSMRIHSGLPKTFWVSVVNTTAYLIKGR